MPCARPFLLYPVAVDVFEKSLHNLIGPADILSERILRTAGRAVDVNFTAGAGDMQTRAAVRTGKTGFRVTRCKEGHCGSLKKRLKVENDRTRGRPRAAPTKEAGAKQAFVCYAAGSVATLICVEKTFYPQGHAKHFAPARRGKPWAKSLPGRMSCYFLWNGSCRHIQLWGYSSPAQVDATFLPPLAVPWLWASGTNIFFGSPAQADDTRRGSCMIRTFHGRKKSGKSRSFLSSHSLAVNAVPRAAASATRKARHCKVQAWRM